MSDSDFIRSPSVSFFSVECASVQVVWWFSHGETGVLGFEDKDHGGEVFSSCQIKGVWELHEVFTGAQVPG